MDAFLVGCWLLVALALLSLGSLLADCQGLIAHVETLVAQSEARKEKGDEANRLTQSAGDLMTSPDKRAHARVAAERSLHPPSKRSKAQ